MKDPKNAQAIMKELFESFGTKISISCKIRCLDSLESTLEFIEMMQPYIHWISIHPRTQSEKSQVPAKWFLVQQIIKSGRVKIPIYGSGDMFSQADIVKFLKFTGAQGVLVARGAIHNPGIFE